MSGLCILIHKTCRTVIDYAVTLTMKPYALGMTTYSGLISDILALVNNLKYSSYLLRYPFSFEYLLRNDCSTSSTSSAVDTVPN